jgi:carbonic anhydrase
MTFQGSVRLLLLTILAAFTVLSCKLPDETNLAPLDRLKQGNKRFISGKPVHPDETLERIRELNKGQHPFAIVVSCSDSRVPPELIFDQGLGSIFSVRTAGNVIGDYELGSIEYAVEHLECKLIVVLGHEDCGAIKAFVETDGHYPHLDHIKDIVDYINNEAEEQALVTTHTVTLSKAIEANIEHGATLLKESEPILKHLADKKEIEIIQALYHMESGEVTFKN